MQVRPESVHVSPNRLEGSLYDTPLEELLQACRKHLVTGTLRVSTAGTEASLELRAGAVDDAAFGELRGERAVQSLCETGGGEYELTQRLPDLSGLLGSAARFDGYVEDVSLVEVMRYCEDNALSCTIIVIHDFDRAEIHYRIGDIDRVLFNGARDDDRIVDIIHWDRARFRVAAPPLDIGIEGWPTVRREPTAPFTIDRSEGRPEAWAEERVTAVRRRRPSRPRPPEVAEPRREPESSLDHPAATWAVLAPVLALAGLVAYLFARAAMGT